MRPWTILMPGRSCQLIGLMPRTCTWALPPLVRSIVIRTMISAAANGSARSLRAMPSKNFVRRTSSRVIWLLDSAMAPLRSTSRLRGSPVLRYVALNPRASDMTITKTATTRAMPSVVASVERQRTRRLRQLYLNGIVMDRFGASGARRGPVSPRAGAGRSDLLFNRAP